MPAMREIRSEDLGIKTIVEQQDADVDVLAVHGLAAHPDDTWTTKAGHTSDGYLNWLSHQTMLPSVLPRARIMRYGYDSKWSGPGTVYSKPWTIADDMIRQLAARRRACAERPLILIAHSFGGIVIEQCIVTASGRNSRIFEPLVGIVFLGAPIRGSAPSVRHALLKFAHKTKDKVYDRPLHTLSSDSEYIRSLKESFCNYLRYNTKPRVVFVFEQKGTDISRILTKDGRRELLHWVSEDTASLDITDRAFEKYARPCDHFQLNKFSSPELEEFRILASELRKMLRDGPAIIAQRRLAHMQQQATSQPSSLSGYTLQVTRVSPMTLAESVPTQQAKQALLWPSLQYDEDWIRTNVTYWEQMTLNSYLVYRTICEACEQSGSHIDFASLHDRIGSHLPKEQIERVWRRLIRSPEDDSAKRSQRTHQDGDLPALRPAYILAVLFMLHVEQSKDHQLPRGDNNEAGVVSQQRRRLISHWGKWIPCGCLPQCTVHWNFANERGMALGGSDECLSYSLLHQSELSARALGVRESLRGKWQRNQHKQIQL